MASKKSNYPVENVPPETLEAERALSDREQADEAEAQEPETTRGGKLKQAWTDDATGKTYLPGETLEGDDVD